MNIVPPPVGLLLTIKKTQDACVFFMSTELKAVLIKKNIHARVVYACPLNCSAKSLLLILFPFFSYRLINS
jgi:hypothetical protein